MIYSSTYLQFDESDLYTEPITENVPLLQDIVKTGVVPVSAPEVGSFNDMQSTADIAGRIRNAFDALEQMMAVSGLKFVTPDGCKTMPEQKSPETKSE